DASALANITAPPFTAAASNLGAGGHVLSAVAANNFGVRATNSINITVDAPPAVTITNPVSGTVLAAPATVLVKASATDADGTVTNVQFLIGPVTLTNVAAAPFSASANNQSAGSYTLTAVATDNAGLTATNSITLSVVTPVAVVLDSTAQLSGTSFQFNYSAN